MFQMQNQGSSSQIVSMLLYYLNSPCDSYPPFPVFHRTSGKGGWVCIACAPSPDARHPSFNATAAIKHEKSQAHQDAMASLLSWGPAEADNWGVSSGHAEAYTWGASPDPVEADNWSVSPESTKEVKWGVLLEPSAENNWGFSFEPYERLRYEFPRRVDPLDKRVRRWIRGIARAEGFETDTEEEDEPECDYWREWTTRRDTWELPAYDWAVKEPWLDPNPPPEESERGGDPRPAADFKFVEKVARARGLTKDRRRLHAFYRVRLSCVLPCSLLP